MKTQKKRRSYHHGDLKTALKEAALKLVCEKGPRGFSLNEASRLAGVTVGAPYRHFRDKEALLAAIICEGNELFEQELRKADDATLSPKERLVEIGMAYIRFAFERADYFSVMFGSGIDKSKYPDVGTSAAKAFGVVQSVAKQIEPSPELAQELAVSSWALVHGLATLSQEGALAAGAKQQSDYEQFKRMIKRIVQE